MPYFFASFPIGRHIFRFFIIKYKAAKSICEHFQFALPQI